MIYFFLSLKRLQCLELHNCGGVNIPALHSFALSSPPLQRLTLNDDVTAHTTAPYTSTSSRSSRSLDLDEILPCIALLPDLRYLHINSTSGFTVRATTIFAATLKSAKLSHIQIHVDLTDGALIPLVCIPSVTSLHWKLRSYKHNPPPIQTKITEYPFRTSTSTRSVISQVDPDGTVHLRMESVSLPNR